MSNCLVSFYKLSKHISSLLTTPHYNFKMPFYAVACGRSVGVFQTWTECEKQVKGFGGAKYKKFNTQAEANSFVSGKSSNSQTSYTNSRPQCTGLQGGSSYNVSSRSNGPTSRPPTKATVKTYSTQCKKPAPKAATISSNDDLLFDNMDDFNDAIMKKMDQLEKDVGDIKSTVLKKRTASKQAIMIDPVPKSNSTTNLGIKRPAETMPDDDSKRRKVDIKHGGSSHSFEMDDSGYVVVYTDGACSSNGTKKARAGMGVYFGENHPLNVSEPVSGRATNNCGEIQATTKAIQLARSMGIDKLAIKTDSKFVIDSVTKWMGGKLHDLLYYINIELFYSKL